MVCAKHEERIKKTDEIVDRWGSEGSNLIEMLHDLQAEYNYLPFESLSKVSEKIGVPLSQIYHVATFYKRFSLMPRGRHHIEVCTGTPCYIKGAADLIKLLEKELGIKVGGTDQDLNFSLSSSGCVGTCGLAPVTVVDGELYGNLNQMKTSKLLKKLKEKKDS